MTVRKYEEQLGSESGRAGESIEGGTLLKAPFLKRQHIDKGGGGKRRPLGEADGGRGNSCKWRNRRVPEVQSIKSIFWRATTCYPPGRGARQTTLKPQVTARSRAGPVDVGAGDEGFFEHIDHERLIRMIELRVDDEAFVR